MAPKRNGDANDDLSGRERKKLKMSTARMIPVQSTSQAGLPKITAGPSTKTTSSLSGLPGAIDLEKFVEARAFEIDAMHTAMKAASASSTHRAWQTLPRHLRRRAASHDVRRVPLRLRDRARAEMDTVRKKALGRSTPRHGKGKRIVRTDAFLKRQRDKIWLETHIWHAKRMHMENMWGYRLAVRPSEKAYRPSYRAAIHGSILHDASYYSMVEIKGPEILLKSSLDYICDPQRPGPGSQRYLMGSRILDTHIYKLGSYPYGLIAPATIMWTPLPAGVSEKITSQSQTGGMKGKAKEQASTVLPPGATALRIRRAWLRYHPSVDVDILDALKHSASQALEKYKVQHGESEELKLEIADLKGHVNVFEVMGPKSSQVIKGALTPILSETRKDFLQFWSSLTDLQTPGSVARGMVIGFKVNDPRLKFPPKNAKSKVGASSHKSSPSTVFPSAQLAENELWDETIRISLAKPRFKKKDLDERRTKNDIPGIPLNATRQDDRIPVILIQRSLEAQNSADSQAIHGWTLMIPAGWSMAFFSSLIYTSTRVGGQRERQVQAYEAGAAYFPRDYPFTSTHNEWAVNQEAVLKETWERKPPAKRVNFEKMGTKHPWRANWNHLLGIPDLLKNAEQTGKQEPAFVPTDREPMMTIEAICSEEETRTQPWLLRGSELTKILTSLSSVLNHGATLLSEINRLRLKRGHDPLATDIKSAHLLKGALVNVKITMCSRGSPQDLAMIYALSDNVVLQWKKAIHLRQTSKVSFDDEVPQEIELAKTIPGQDAIIGYITTGQYSLARGYGYGIGAIPLSRLLELEEQNLRLHPNQRTHSGMPIMLVGMRNTDGAHCRAAHLEVLLGD